MARELDSQQSVMVVTSIPTAHRETVSDLHYGVVTCSFTQVFLLTWPTTYSVHAPEKV